MTLTREENEKLARLLGFEPFAHDFCPRSPGGNCWLLGGIHYCNVWYGTWAAYDIADPRTLLDTPEKAHRYIEALKVRFAEVEDYGLAQWVALKIGPADIARAVLEAVDA